MKKKNEKFVLEGKVSMGIFYLFYTYIIEALSCLFILKHLKKLKIFIQTKGINPHTELFKFDNS